MANAQHQAKQPIVMGPEALNEEPFVSRRLDYLKNYGWENATLETLPAHASARRYYRVHNGEKPALLMDATLDTTEPLMWYVTVDQHLRKIGLTAPEIFDYDITDDWSFALIEDFGDEPYDALVDQGENPLPLYEKAIDVLAYMHNHDETTNVDVSSYPLERMLMEASNTIHWYVPAARGSAVSEEAFAEYRRIWTDILSNMPPIKDSLIMYDYIFNNMMRVSGQEGIQDCGLLDFQAARIGPAIYDVVSLLEDIRRDLDPSDFTALRKRYLDQVQITETEEDFDTWFAVMTTQRHCKNLGNLVRLFVRDGKPDLLQYIPRMRTFTWTHLQKPVFAELKDWFEKNEIDLTKDLQEGFEHANGYPEK